jgi:hypothetical protein
MRTPSHNYTAEQLDYLRRHETINRRILTVSFNNHFGTKLTTEQIKGTCTRIGLRTGRTGCFKKGNVPYNTGTKGLNQGSSTSYKAGQMPPNWCPVGTVIEPKDGYTKIKVAEPKSWKHKHVWLWEQMNGPVPDGCCIIFSDSDKKNFEPNNLICVQRSELLFLNRKSLIKTDTELTRSAVNVARVAVKVSKLKREIKKSISGRI